MIIDVALSSCARVEMMEASIASFRENIKTRHTLRWIIVEDKVDDVERAEKGRQWIDDNKALFDKIVYSDVNLTYVYCYGEILKHVESDIFIRYEDDFLFTRQIDIDPIISVVEKHRTVAAIVLKRDDAITYAMDEYVIDGCVLLDQELFSVSAGVFNTEVARKIVGYSGTGQCHEWGVLTPAKKALGYSTYIWGGRDEPYVIEHVGKREGHIKGTYTT